MSYGAATATVLAGMVHTHLGEIRRVYRDYPEGERLIRLNELYTYQDKRLSQNLRVLDVGTINIPLHIQDILRIFEGRRTRTGVNKGIRSLERMYPVLCDQPGVI